MKRPAPDLFGAFCYFTVMAKRFGFGRKEKLKSRKQIEELFLNGKNFAVFPLRVTYQFLPSEEPFVQVAVSVGKRYFKKAVDRNRIKRLLRETYRLQKQGLSGTLKEKKLKGFIFFIYTDKTIAPFNIIKEAMNKCLKRLENSAANENHS